MKIPVLLFVLTSTSPDVDLGPTLCEHLLEQQTRLVDERDFELLAAPPLGNGAAVSEASASSATESLEDSLASLRHKRASLALDAAQTRSSMLRLICSNEETAAEEHEHLLRQRLAQLQRRWLQLDCHRIGKDLAIAEVQRDAGDGSPTLARRIAFYQPLIERCIENGEAAGEVRFLASDGGVVHGELHGDGARAVVLAHGGRFTKESWRRQIPAFVDAGLRVLAIDFRGRGRSRGPNGRSNEVFADVLGAVRYLHETGSRSVSVVGASFGGGAAAQASVLADEGEIDNLVLLAHSSIERPGQMKGRKLFLVARDDVRGGGIRRLDEIRAQYEAAPGPKQLMVVDGAAHAQFLFDTEQGDDVLGRIVEFLAPR